MRKDGVSSNFDLLFVSNADAVLAPDMAEGAKKGLLRMELLREHSTGTLPYVR